jgi:hypothetical protein
VRWERAPGERMHHIGERVGGRADIPARSREPDRQVVQAMAQLIGVSARQSGRLRTPATENGDEPDDAGGWIVQVDQSPSIGQTRRRALCGATGSRGYGSTASCTTLRQFPRSTSSQ